MQPPNDAPPLGRYHPNYDVLYESKETFKMNPPRNLSFMLDPIVNYQESKINCSKFNKKLENIQS